MVKTILAYVITVGLAMGGLTSLPITLAGGLGARASGGIGLHVAMLVGGVLTWVGLAWLWQALEGAPMPLAVLAIGFAAIGAHGSISHDKLNEIARQAIGAEMWAMLLVAVGLVIAGPVRWY